MRYTRISADCHIDLCWLPPDLFTSSCSAAMKDRMPFVTEGPKGPKWVTKRGPNLGLVNGMGSAGREYVPGKIHRSDRMAATGLYEDGKRGSRRLTDPELRLKDQERDGVQAEVLYGILGATRRLNDAEAAGELVRIYNEWLADFCDTHPVRYAGLACIPNFPVKAAVKEMMRVIKRGSVRGLEIANSHDIVLWHRLCGIGPRLLGRPVSEYGRLCHGAGGHEGGHRGRRAFMLTCMKRLASATTATCVPRRVAMRRAQVQSASAAGGRQRRIERAA